MKLIICDDNQEFLTKIANLCKDIVDAEDIVEAYSSPVALLKEARLDGNPAELYILDVEMPEMNGYQLRDELEKLAYGSRIIFLTIHQELVLEAFGKYVIGFIDKNNYIARLPKMIREVKHEIALNTYIDIGDNTIQKQIPQNRIVYIKSDHVYTKVIYATGRWNGEWIETEEALVRVSLSEWENRLGPDFFRVNNSNLINFAYVKFIQGMFALEDGTCIKIPRRKRVYCCNQYMEYCVRKARYI